MVAAHLTETVATYKGHLDQVQDNQRSTRIITTETQEDEVIADTQCHNVAFATVQDINKIYTDQTGSFPVQSSRGFNYLMIMYSYDVNAILADPIKNRSAGELQRAYTEMYQYLEQRGNNPQVHWMDNEAPQYLLTFNTKRSTSYQLSPPHMHRRNAAE